MSPYGIINTLSPRQHDRHFADDIFKCIFLNENVYISIKISLKFVPMGPINNIPALVQIMAWRRPGDKPLSAPMMITLLTHICITRPRWVKPQWFNTHYTSTQLHLWTPNTQYCNCKFPLHWDNFRQKYYIYGGLPKFFMASVLMPNVEKIQRSDTTTIPIWKQNFLPVQTMILPSGDGWLGRTLIYRHVAKHLKYTSPCWQWLCSFWTTKT